MKKFLCVLLSLLALFSFASCGYASAYRAIGLITMHNRSTYSVSFYNLKGTMCETLRLTTEESGGELYYSATLEEGEVNVYYDVDGEKELLFTVKGGETVDGHGGHIESGRRIYIMIETVGSAKNGTIRVSTKPIEGDRT